MAWPMDLKGREGPQAETPAWRASFVSEMRRWAGASCISERIELENTVERSCGTHDVADGEGLRGIAVVAVEVDSDVDIDDVAVF